MAKIILIVAQSENRVIGRGNQMPWHLPRDLAYFKKHTSGFPVIMGRKTFVSIGRPLPQRRNIVLTRTQTANMDGVEIFPTLESALLATEAAEKVFIIGGGEIYRQALPVAQQILLTQVAVTIPDGEVFFPLLPAKEWQLTTAEYFPQDEKNAFDLTFCCYDRIV